MSATLTPHCTSEAGFQLWSFRGIKLIFSIVRLTACADTLLKSVPLENTTIRTIDALVTTPLPRSIRVCKINSDIGFFRI